MTEFLIGNRRVVIAEPWTVFTVYGSFTDPATGQGFIIVRMPSGRVPWSRKIWPALRRLVMPWRYGDRLDLYVGGEWTVIGAGNVYSDTDEPIPTDPRLWDCRGASRYEWTPTEGLRFVE